MHILLTNIYHRSSGSFSCCKGAWNASPRSMKPRSKEVGFKQKTVWGSEAPERVGHLYPQRRGSRDQPRRIIRPLCANGPLAKKSELKHCCSRRGLRGGAVDGTKRTVSPRFRTFVAGGREGDGERFRRFKELDTWASTLEI